jgi:hypothetical protein
MSTTKDHAAIWREKLAMKRRPNVGVHGVGTGTVVGGCSGGRAQHTAAAAAAAAAAAVGSHADDPSSSPGADSSDSPDDDDDDEDEDVKEEEEEEGEEEKNSRGGGGASGGREMCWRCRRVQRLCVCGLVRGIVGDTPIANKLGITVLQDRHEALKRPFGSAIVAELALEVRVGTSFFSLALFTSRYSRVTAV